MPNNFSLAVVTGGASGIGGAVAALLRDGGWSVHVIDRRPSELADVHSHICDVTDESGLVGVASEIGPIGALVLAAGINLRPQDGPAEKLSLDAWHKTLAVNLTGCMLSVRAFRPKLRQDGSIVTLGSVAAMRAMPWADAYTATKGAIVALTRSWAVDYSRDGIRVNCVCPGPTDTAMMAGMIEQHHSNSQLQLPQQRMATSLEVAEVIAFLVSPKASYLSGAIIPVDGAATAHSAGMPFPRRR
ncbi:SDR family NAD(P)-dependent oxidoreductase [Methylocapsa sp. S129]|uniref:SDR family NAD(P)-dependent oxidoreductase n=1 Tax=Methylocapsa sp. S129 TaxID=1641869 RepID=UPI00131B3927|nr:SDR family oxidoreductase [Methylocapsa sp. S129]